MWQYVGNDGMSCYARSASLNIVHSPLAKNFVKGRSFVDKFGKHVCKMDEGQLGELADSAALVA